jgi:hypothetical protein
MHCLIFCWNIVDIKKIFGDSFFYEVIVYLHLFHLGMKNWIEGYEFYPHIVNPYLCTRWTLSKRLYDTSTNAVTGAVHCGSFVGKDFSLLVVSYR